MKTTFLVVVFGGLGFWTLFYSKTLTMLLGKGCAKSLKYPHTSS